MRVRSDSVAAALPEAVLRDLRAAFAAEVRSRLPHLQEVTDLEVARRDAHTLASSAWVVGEQEIAAVARAVENGLPGGPREQLLELLHRFLEEAAS